MRDRDIELTKELTTSWPSARIASQEKDAERNQRFRAGGGQSVAAVIPGRRAATSPE